MEIRLLGVVDLWVAGEAWEVGAARPQAVLAALAVDAGRPIVTETLIDRVWGDTPPAEARNVLYSYLSRTRRLLRQAAARAGETAVRIERRHAGYVLDVDPELVDLHRFRRLVVEDGAPRRDDGSRAAALAEALRLWRGAPLAGVPGRWATRVRDSWERRRLDAVVRWAQLELRLGNAATLVTDLPDLVAEYPLAEPLEALLMRALHAAGRGAEALHRYTVVRRRLADELGTDPGPELRAVHEAILHGEPPHQRRTPWRRPSHTGDQRSGTSPSPRESGSTRTRPTPRRTGRGWG
jgi:DNA-binding SARP family transcriptional activator